MISIRVTSGKTEILYEQQDNSEYSHAATCEDGYSKGSSQVQLIKTIKSICEEVKKLENKVYPPIS